MVYYMRCSRKREREKEKEKIEDAVGVDIVE